MLSCPAQIVTCCIILKQLNQKEGEHVINFEKIILEYSEQYTDFAASTIAFMESQEKRSTQMKYHEESRRKKDLFLTKD